MKTITLKDIPAPVHSALKQRAKVNGRSLNKEVLTCLEMIVAPRRINPVSFLDDIRKHRVTLPGKLNDRLIQHAKNEGRP